MKPGRLSVFNYAHMPQLFAAQRKIKDEDLPKAEEKMAILQDTIATLTGCRLPVHRYGPLCASRR